MAAPHFLTGKADQRRAALLQRAAGRPDWGIWLAAHVLASGLIRPTDRVAGVWPLPGEIDLRPLLLALVGRGHAVLLPETPPRGHPLIFRSWRPGAAMVQERFGTWRPEGPVADPDVALVPLLAFDRLGRRLGYGGGYYDRTLAARPDLRTIGCAYACQEVDAVPVLPHDAAMQAVATERGVIFPAEH